MARLSVLLCAGLLLLLLLAFHAVRASRVEEAPAALLTSSVPGFFAADGTTEAVEQTGEEQTHAGSPHKGEGLDTEFGNLAVAAEGGAALYVASASL